MFFLIILFLAFILLMTTLRRKIPIDHGDVPIVDNSRELEFAGIE